MPVDTIPTTPEGTRDTGGHHYRYPGSPPFQDSEIHRRLFKGRAKEADRVLHSILSSDLFLLYSVSGLGKTSLLNAGVMHGLRDRGYWPVSVRLNNIKKSPAEQIREQIEQAAATDPSIEVLRSPDAPKDADTSRSLWELLTSIEVWRANELQEIVLILDQFEELFTLGWNEDHQKAFIADFGEVVRGHRTHQSSSSRKFQPAPDVKIVLAMREDALGELESLSAEVPRIMDNRFRLGPLDPMQAEHAIREPADLDDPQLGSQRFTYTAAAAQELLSFLRTKTLDGSTIQTAAVDPSQLQIVCQYVERAIVPKKAASQPADSIVEIDASDLGGKEGLNRILSEFYGRTIESFPGRSQSAVRDLCENGLISRSHRRLSLEQGEVEATYAVSPELLQQLVDARLLRSEPRVGSVYYELAHDTLVRPILEYRDWQRRQRTKRRLRWIGIAAGLALIAIVFGVFMIGSSRATSENLEAQEAAALEADEAVEAAAKAALAAEEATQAAAEVAPAVETAAVGAVVAADQRQEAIAALAQAQAAAEAAQVQDAAVVADLRGDPTNVEIGQAAAEAAQAAATAAQEESKAAMDAAKTAEAEADAAAQAAAEATPAALEEAVTAAGRAQTAAGQAQAAADAAQAALTTARASAEAAQAALAAANAQTAAAQSALAAANAQATAAQSALAAANAQAAAAQSALAAANARVKAAQPADIESAQAARTLAQEAVATAERAVATAQDAAQEQARAVDESEQAAMAAKQAVVGGALQEADASSRDAVEEAQNAAAEAQNAAAEAQNAAAEALTSAQAAQLPRIKLERGEESGQYRWYKVSLSGFEADASVTLTCRSGANPTGFYTGTLTMDENGFKSESQLCFSLPNQEHWVTGGGVESNRLNW